MFGFHFCFRNLWALKNLKSIVKTGAFMVATGELIRSMNYVDDITATLRRIVIYIPSMTPEERKRLAEHLRSAGKALNEAIADLEKAEK
jgi:hypothetical protein